MLQDPSLSVQNEALKLFSKFNITFRSPFYHIESDDFFEIKDCSNDLVQFLVLHPEFLKSKALGPFNKQIKFSLAAWLVSCTDLSLPLASEIFKNCTKRSISENQLKDYAYISNYIRKYNPEVLKSLKHQVFNFYNNTISSELKPLFVRLWSCFVDEMDDECKKELSVNWFEGKRDLALASLCTLLKFNPPDEIFDDLSRFEQIGDLKVLADVVLAKPENNLLFRIFRDQICLSSEFPAAAVKRAKLSNRQINNNSNWIEQWTRVMKLNFIMWPAFEPAHPIDLLSKLTFSKLNFKTFLIEFQNYPENLILSLLNDLIPGILDQCTWLLNILPRPLLHLFAHLLKDSNTSHEILLSLCKLFMDNLLGTTARKSFINYLAAHVEHKIIGERCLGLIESFIERFPESRYVCLALIKSLLDGVDSWEPRLLIPFYSAFSLMARTSDSAMNDLILLLKKQIYSSDVHYKRIGARGVGIFLRVNGSADLIKAKDQTLLPDPDDTFNDIAACSQKPRDTAPAKINYHLRIIISLLEESIKSLRSDQQSLLIFLNYFDLGFDSLDDELKDWIGDWCRSVFHSTFITQIDEDLHKYKYENDQDNPIAIKFDEGEMKNCAPLLLNILGKFEKYQNSGDLEGIDALQGCAIEIDSDFNDNEIENLKQKTNLSISKDFHTKFVIVNHFRTTLNTFFNDESIKENDQMLQTTKSTNENQNSILNFIISIQRELRIVLKNGCAFLSEFKLFPECYALIKLKNQNNNISKSNSKFSDEPMILNEISEGLEIEKQEQESFLDEILKEAKKPENRIVKTTSGSSSQLLDVNEKNLQKSFIPLKVSLLEEIVYSLLLLNEDLKNFLFKEIETHLEVEINNTKIDTKTNTETNTKTNTNNNKITRLLDCLLRLEGGKLSIQLIEIICKFSFNFSSSQKKILVKNCKEILENSNSLSSNVNLLQNVCKLVIEVLKCPELICDCEPLKLIKITLNSLNPNSNVIKQLLTLSGVNVCDLIKEEMKCTEVPIKNRLILLKGISQRITKELKGEDERVVDVARCQEIFGAWADLVQNIRSEGNLKILQGIVKQSHVVFESFLSCQLLKEIEGNSILIDNSSTNNQSEFVFCLLKTVQQSTRGLQIICNHLKYNEIQSSASESLAIPNLKKTLEAVIFRVKEILQRSGCLGAFWMGNLKHRDLDGQELLSQVELLNLDNEKEKIDELSEEFIVDSTVDSELISSEENDNDNNDNDNDSDNDNDNDNISDLFSDDDEN